MSALSLSVIRSFSITVSLKGAADEIIVVDTGSSDKTRDMAAELGAKVADFEWIDDFSAAKNFAIAHVSRDTDWVIFLDADEGFIYPDKVRGAIVKINDTMPQVDAVMITRLNTDATHENRGLGRDVALRVFRNKEYLRFRNRIHENIVNLTGELSIYYDSGDLAAYHTGYSLSVIDGKNERNLRLLLKDIEENGETPWHYIFLSDCYFGTREYDKSLKYAILSLDSPVKTVAGQIGLYHNAIESMRQLAPKYSLDEMLALSEKARSEFPDMPEFYGESGMMLCGMGRLAEARESLRMAIELYEKMKNNYSRHEFSYFTDSVAAIVSARLGEIEAIFGDDEMAEKYFDMAGDYDSSNESVRMKRDKFEKERIMNAKKNNKTKISAAYIVKNEAGTFERSIASLDGAYDELTVVDTGSTDDTVKIAERHGARVLHYEWNDDFAAARNFALDNLSPDTRWVIFLDGDEYFTEETRRNIRNAVERAERDKKNVLLIKWCNYDSDTGEHLVDVMTPRIFRYSPHLRYHGRIHEQLRENGGAVSNVAIADDKELRLIHTGYSSSLSKEKAERNLRILSEEMSVSEHKEDCYMAIAECYDGLDDAENAIKYAMLDIKRGRQAINYASRSYRILMKRLAAMPSKFEERREIVCRAVRDFPELPEFHAELAECFAYIGEYDRAIAEAGRAKEVFESGKKEFPDSIEPVQFDDAMMKVLTSREEMWLSLSRKARAIKIAACVIVKNEERDMVRWLDNAAVYADEIIVCDTGSVDATRDIVAEAAKKNDKIKLFDFEWADDFSLAKNFAVEKVSHDIEWIAFLDADETFSRPSYVRGVMAAIDDDSEAEAVRVTIVNVDEDDNMREMQRFMNVRVFRNRRNIRYVGAVHENVMVVDDDAGDAKNVRAVDEPHRLLVTHTGYSSGRMAAKTKRNFAMLKREIEANGGVPQPHHYRYLADSYIGMGEYENALDFAVKAIKLPVQAIGSSSDMYYDALICMEALDAPLVERLSLAEEARREYGGLPDYHAEAGMIYELMGEHERARENIERAETVAANGDLNDKHEASHYGDVRARALAMLSMANVKLGDMQDGLKTATESLKENRYNEDALDAYADALAADGETGLAELLEKICGFFDETESDLVFLSRWAEGSGRINLYMTLAAIIKEKYNRDLPRVALYRAANEGDRSLLREELTREISETFPRLVISLISLEKEQTREARAMSDRLRLLLPDAAADAWDAYMGRGDIKTDDAFSLMLPYFVRYGDDEQLARFASLSVGFSPRALLDAARMAQDDERWAPAFAIYMRLPQGAKEADAGYWTGMGICLYHLREFDSAEECFDSAERLGGETAEIRSYRHFMRSQNEK